ncbi:hypothetical protein BDD12DRAFT_885501 [Trichophaea hybrida]|nr:hypothetical protein BDD12DRAFT_885501 [Trichophaea hybrida]
MAAPRSFEQFLLEGSAYIVTKFQRDGKQGLFLNIDLEHASKHLIDYPNQKIATKAIAIGLERLYNQDLSREKWAEFREAYRGWFGLVSYPDLPGNTPNNSQIVRLYNREDSLCRLASTIPEVPEALDVIQRCGRGLHGHRAGRTGHLPELEHNIRLRMFGPGYNLTPGRLRLWHVPGMHIRSFPLICSQHEAFSPAPYTASNESRSSLIGSPDQRIFDVLRFIETSNPEPEEEKEVTPEPSLVNTPKETFETARFTTPRLRAKPTAPDRRIFTSDLQVEYNNDRETRFEEISSAYQEEVETASEIFLLCLSAALHDPNNPRAKGQDGMTFVGPSTWLDEQELTEVDTYDKLKPRLDVKFGPTIKMSTQIINKIQKIKYSPDKRVEELITEIDKIVGSVDRSSAEGILVSAGGTKHRGLASVVEFSLD